MKIKINKEVIAAYKPCKDRFDKYLESYSNFNGDIQGFLDLSNISYKDKLWVACHIIPRSVLEVFALDCAFSTYAVYADAAYADIAYVHAAYASDHAYAADCAADHVHAAAAHTADAAAYAVYAANVRKKEQDNQIAILKYLISEER